VTLRLAPSILSADFGHLADQIALVEAAGADLIHIDVMDGHFVPNLTMGPPVVRAVKRVTSLPLDVHLMIEEPDRYLDAFIDAGATMLTVHVEAVPHLHRTLSQIRHLGALAGAAINPSTPVAALAEICDQLDHIVIMSVNPGFGGQRFIQRSLQKVAEAKRLLQAAGSSAAIEVDGGVDHTNAAALVQQGASILVAGATIFGADDPADATRSLRAAATEAGR
jgi:ribulose-phosphate 3-epimerase